MVTVRMYVCRYVHTMSFANCTEYAYIVVEFVQLFIHSTKMINLIIRDIRTAYLGASSDASQFLKGFQYNLK